MNRIDATRKACPMPVIMAKKEAEKKTPEFSVLVDNKTAVENLKRFAGSIGYSADIKEEGDVFEVVMKQIDNAENPSENYGVSTPGKSWAVFLGHDSIGEGDRILGVSLMKMCLYTLSQSDDLPTYILFMNGGVRIPTEQEQAIVHLKDMEARGTKLLVCGTCLNFFGLENSLNVGIVSNMYDITSAMTTVDKVVTL